MAARWARERSGEGRPKRDKAAEEEVVLCRPRQKMEASLKRRETEDDHQDFEVAGNQAGRP